MHNRLASLFALDELLASGSTRHPTPPARRARKRPVTRPAAAPRKTRTSGAATPLAQSFDNGAPIRCEHDLPPNAPGLIPLPADTPPVVAHALDDSYHVEAFEDDAPVEEEEPPLSSREIEAESEETLSEGSAVRYGAPSAPRYSRVRSAPVESPSSFSAQMEAVERDLAELATRTTTPEEVAATPPPEADEAPPAPRGTQARGHSVFDAMAKGMNYATEFQLPAVQLSQMFSALDKELDATVARESTPSAPPSPPPTSQLIKDLVELAPREDASPPPVPTTSPDAAQPEAR